MDLENHHHSLLDAIVEQGVLPLDETLNDRGFGFITVPIELKGAQGNRETNLSPGTRVALVLRC